MSISLRLVGMEIKTPSQQQIPKVTIAEVVNNSNKNLILATFDTSDKKLAKLLYIPAGSTKSNLVLQLPLQPIFKPYLTKMLEFKAKDNIFVLEEGFERKIFPWQHEEEALEELALIKLYITQKFEEPNIRTFIVDSFNNLTQEGNFWAEDVPSAKVNYALTLTFDGSNLENSKVDIRIQQNNTNESD